MKNNINFHKRPPKNQLIVQSLGKTWAHPHILQVCANSLGLGVVLWVKEDRIYCIRFQWCVTSVVLFFPPGADKPRKVHLCGGFYSQYFNIPFLRTFVLFWLIHNDVILVIVISSLKIKQTHEGKQFENKCWESQQNLLKVPWSRKIILEKFCQRWGSVCTSTAVCLLQTHLSAEALRSSVSSEAESPVQLCAQRHNC